ncbi:MAG: phospholipase D-like domain-containing protein [Cyanobacteriota bacterium]|nr:phospholipase D-like domain-containing protein [Cyanobacteriota bacterium]
MRIFVSILFLIFSFTSAFAESNAYFTPSLECENNLIKRIDNAQKSIDAAIYAINNKDVIKALKRAHKRGVKIRILTDRLQAGQRTSKVKDIHEYGINIRVHSKNKIEHNKFAVFDFKEVLTGSYNWTEPASKKNSENCIFINRNKKAVREYHDRFNYLWQINTRKSSEKWFKRRK